MFPSCLFPSPCYFEYTRAADKGAFCPGQGQFGLVEGEDVRETEVGGWKSGCSCERFFSKKKNKTTVSQKDGKAAREGEEVGPLPKSITPPKMETAGRLGGGREEGRKGPGDGNTKGR